MATNFLTPEQKLDVLRMLGERRPRREIAEKVGCSHQNITFYSMHNREAIKAARDAYDAQAIREGIFNREARLAGMQARYNDLRQIVGERGCDPGMAVFPGGETGYLVREPQIVKVYDVKVIEKPGPEFWSTGDVFVQPEPGEEAAAASADDGDPEELERLIPTGSVQVVYVAKFDAALERSLAKLEDDAAKEMGERQKRVDVTSGGGTWEDLLRTATTPEQAAVLSASEEPVQTLDELLSTRAVASDDGAG